ncbi:hypothetical protein EVG20_g8345 [Dentipellis fragilis]|uniref:BAH domain-containing protein n=1 Tax=Dentipellis fragilis TaxID=205917 RepID=A0A4Y9Y6H6_9AGAM|nr:hypothetical protein EVG20_g8345 [Dentipellis fragilis]
MAPETPVQTPTRRSKRFQPNVFASTSALAPHVAGVDVWTSKPLHRRPTEPQDAFDTEEDPDEEYSETRFYDAFARRKGPTSRGTHGRHGSTKAKVTEEEGEVYKVGDTVLVATNPKRPSVGVIVGMWEVKNVDGEDRRRGASLRVRIHWFLRPAELAKTRAERSFFENEVYYSIDSTAVVPTSSIISHCIVSGTPPADVSAGSPPKRRRTDVGRTDDKKATESFYCASAVNAMRGLFYDLNWTRHSSQAAGMSPEAGGVVEWGTGRAWEVLVENEAKPQPRVSRKAALKRVVEEAEGEEDEGSEDDYKQPAERAQSEVVSEDERPARRRGRRRLEDDDDDDEDDVVPEIPKTPSKKRKRTTPTTPTTPRTPRTPRRTGTTTPANDTPENAAPRSRNRRRIRSKP